MRKTPILAAVILLALAGLAWAAGTLTVTSAGGTDQTRVYALAWTSTAGGAVSGNTLTIKRGHIKEIEIVPSSGGTQPSDQYDMLLKDGYGVDLLEGNGADLSNVTATRYQFATPLFHSAATSLDLVISNAGSAKTGVVYITVGP